MKKDLKLIGHAEIVDFPELGVRQVPARTDTGAKTSAIWASNISEQDGVLQFVLFGEGSAFYTGEVLRIEQYEQRAVASSTGTVELRYVVKFLVEIEGKRIRASFTLTDRSTQSYPVLIGRNILRGKFLVDVKQAKAQAIKNKSQSLALQSWRERENKS